MTRYIETNDNWKTAKALSYFINFVNNHNARVEDNDAFAMAAELVTPDELQQLIRDGFPAKTFQRMVNWKDRRNRLDFDDENKEVMREVWSFPFARKRFRAILGEIVGRFLAGHPLDKTCGERFAVKAKELQKTMGLSDFELDIVLVLAFVNKLKKNGKEAIILFSKWTLTEEMVGDTVHGDMSFKQYIQDSFAKE